MNDASFSRQLARHVHGRHDIDAELGAWMRLLLLDYCAVTAGGVGRSSAIAARAAVSLSDRVDASHPAAIHGTGQWASVQDAALVNGITAHGLELDDTHEEASLHPGVVIFPSVLAVADSLGSTTASVLAAATVGYDVMCEVGALISASASYARGFHPTGIAGVVGAAAAVASLLRLDEDRATHAIGLAADLAAGSLEFLSDGSWTKRLNAGHAAANGIRAAGLAAAGFSAPERSLEGRDGFLNQYGNGAQGRRLRLGFGDGALNTSIKFYPCCRYMHGSIDLLLDIQREWPSLQLDQIRSIDIGVIQAGARLVSEPPERKLVVDTPVDAQFNMRFGGALALHTGRAAVDQFDDAPAIAEGLIGWMEKVNCYTSDALESAFPARWAAEVSVALADGQVISRSEDSFRGSPGRRATPAEVRDKAASLLGAEAAAALADSVAQLEPAQPISGRLNFPEPA